MNNIQKIEENVENELLENPLFSIIIPVYNSEQFLTKCIDSLLIQRISDFELLLIDDGSTDLSGYICDEYAAKDMRIHVFHEHNQGASAARNRGLKEARGKYVNFVDSDDWVAEDYLETYMKARSDYDYDLVYTEMIREKNGDRSYMTLIEQSARSGEDLSEMIAHLLSCGEFGFTCNKSFKREIITLYSIIFNEQISLYEDALFTADYCLHISSLIVFPYKIYYYRIKDSFNHLVLNYHMYHLATRTGVGKIDILVNKLDSDLLKLEAELFCDKWKQIAILYMYLHGENISRKDRLNYLKEFRNIFDKLKYEGAIFRIISFVMKIKNDKVTDAFLCVVRLIYDLKQYCFKMFNHNV